MVEVGLDLFNDDTHPSGHISREALEARGQVQPSQVLVSQGCKVPVFWDSPKTSSDPFIEDWITDVEWHIASCNLTGLTATAFVVEHLSGKARQEILGCGLAKDTPEHIFKVLKTIFGDGLNLGQLRSLFFSSLVMGSP